jgi:uncharacterized lipoprotein YehR (DUF1307 family)
MKKLTSLIFMMILALSLTACAGMKEKQAKPIKCPACGYEGLDYIYQP